MGPFSSQTCGASQRVRDPEGGRVEISRLMPKDVSDV